MVGFFPTGRARLDKAYFVVAVGIRQPLIVFDRAGGAADIKRDAVALQDGGVTIREAAIDAFVPTPVVMTIVRWMAGLSTIASAQPSAASSSAAATMRSHRRRGVMGAFWLR